MGLLALAAVAAGVAGLGDAVGQTTTTTTDPTAASGMTQGLPGVSSQRQAELMHVRARAQAARPDAERAAMERSAEAALDQKTQEQVLLDARETKRLKEEAARDMQMQRAANAYQGVSRREMNSWADNSGRVKVDGGIPPEVLAALPPEEEPVKEKKKFGFIGMPARAVKGAAGATVGAAKKTVTILPGVGKKNKEEPVSSSTYVDPSQYYSQQPGEAPTSDYVEPVQENKGFFKKVGSSLPFVGGKKNEEEFYPSGDFISQEPAPVVVGSPAAGAPPAVAPSPVSYTTPAPAANPDTGINEFAVETEKEGFLKKISPFGGRDAADEAIPAPEPVMASAAAADGYPVAEEKTGLGGKFKNLAGKVIPGGGSPAANDGTIDASLFPQEGDSGEMMADTSGLRPKFFRKPNLELPEISMPGSSNQEMPKPETPVAKKERTPVHGGGTAYYLVSTNGAQFMRFASGTLGSEAMTLSAGTRVKKTKVGDEWSTVQLSNGSTGIIKNKDLRPDDGSTASGVASAPPVPTATSIPNRGGFATTASGGARITAPVSATGAGVSDVPGPPVTMPESNLPPTAETAETALGALE